MNTSPVSVYFSPNHHAADTLIGFIDRALIRLDCGIFSLTHKGIGDALLRAHQRGVVTRVIMDADEARAPFSLDERLAAGGIPVRLDTSSGLFHHKIAICDAGTPQAAVATGSFNWTHSADQRNAENLVLIRLNDVVDTFSVEFERLWALNKAP